MRPDFSQVVWTAPRIFRAGSQTFQAQTFGPNMDSAADGFVTYKEPKHFEDYSRWWPADFNPSAVLELGIWAGGSVVLWNELLHPKRLVALDIKSAESIGKENWARLQRYEKEQPAVGLYWKTSQGDPIAIRRILDEHFPDGIDLVIDDASHLYGLTRSSFELIFPRVRSGGWYVIEDWPWDVVDPFPGQESFLQSGPPLSLLIRDLALISGTEKNLIESFQIRRTVSFIQRGSAELKPNFSISDYLPKPSLRDVGFVTRRMLSHYRGRGW